MLNEESMAEARLPNDSVCEVRDVVPGRLGIDVVKAVKSLPVSEPERA